jgi:hypothetical protein
MAKILKNKKMKHNRLPSPENYYLDRLFDPEDLYYTSMDELLKRYKKRDLMYFMLSF